MDASRNTLNLAHHRSRSRIRDLGEVFTPEKYVNQMLDMLDKSVWTNTNVVFYEPTCGHGNFVLAIVKRRLDAFFKQAKRKRIKNPHFYAVANTLNNIWAIDIDSKNIKLCQERVISLTFSFLKEKGAISNILTKKNMDFLTHVFCCIDWQIHQNEALSCLEKDTLKAKQSAEQANVSRKWMKKNKHLPINFEMSWCQYFNNCKKRNLLPSEYMKHFRFIRSLVSGNKKSNTLLEVNWK